MTAPLRAGTAFDARCRKLVPIVQPRPRACDEERPPGGLQGLPYCAVSAGPAPRCALALPRIRAEIEIEIESDVVRDRGGEEPSEAAEVRDASSWTHSN